MHALKLKANPQDVRRAIEIRVDTIDSLIMKVRPDASTDISDLMKEVQALNCLLVPHERFVVATAEFEVRHPMVGRDREIMTAGEHRIMASGELRVHAKEIAKRRNMSVDDVVAAAAENLDALPLDECLKVSGG